MADKPAIIEVDARGRVALGRFVQEAHRRFTVHVASDGVIELTPIPGEETSKRPSPPPGDVVSRRAFILHALFGMEGPFTVQELADCARCVGTSKQAMLDACQAIIEEKIASGDVMAIVTTDDRRTPRYQLSDDN